MGHVKHQESYILILASIHDVMAAEAAVHEAGMWCDMIPTPRQISSDCGMAVEIAAVDWPAVRALIGARPIRLRDVYREHHGVYEALVP